MKKWLKITILTVFLLTAVSISGFFLYVSDYYRADASMTETTVRLENNLTILSPSVSGDTGLIFYPGGKVDHRAYLPLLEQLSQNGITCVLVEMPFHLAVFDADAADDVFSVLPDIQNWYIGGHSLGGAMAGSYASGHTENIRGLILLGSYLYGDFPKEQSLTIYGSEDKVLDRSKITYTENVVQIEGGNHAQFGCYGPQKGDGTASITAGEQQAQTVEAILEFIGNH